MRVPELAQRLLQLKRRLPHRRPPIQAARLEKPSATHSTRSQLFARASEASGTWSRCVPQATQKARRVSQRGLRSAISSTESQSFLGRLTNVPRRRSARVKTQRTSTPTMLHRDGNTRDLFGAKPQPATVIESVRRIYR